MLRLKNEFRYLSLAMLLCAAILQSDNAKAYGEMNCGLRPLPQLGCQIGRCVNGQWEQVCNQMSCGLKPLPNLGCHIGECVNGTWTQVCNGAGEMSCGLRPLPNLGCRIGNCVNGQWEQVCN